MCSKSYDYKAAYLALRQDVLGIMYPPPDTAAPDLPVRYRLAAALEHSDWMGSVNQPPPEEY